MVLPAAAVADDQLQKLFDEFDTDSDGSLDKARRAAARPPRPALPRARPHSYHTARRLRGQAELRRGLISMRIDVEHLDDLVAAADANGDGRISLDEFHELCLLFVKLQGAAASARRARVHFGDDADLGGWQECREPGAPAPRARAAADCTPLTAALADCASCRPFWVANRQMSATVTVQKVCLPAPILPPRVRHASISARAGTRALHAR
jgi:hypothetical protein